MIHTTSVLKRFIFRAALKRFWTFMRHSGFNVKIISLQDCSNRSKPSLFQIKLFFFAFHLKTVHCVNILYCCEKALVRIHNGNTNILQTRAVLVPFCVHAFANIYWCWNFWQKQPEATMMFSIQGMFLKGAYSNFQIHFRSKSKKTTHRLPSI